jgi:hypothetical protein
MAAVHKTRREKLIEILDEVAKFFEAHDPKFYALCLKEIPKLRQVSNPGYKANGVDVQVTVKVPMALFLSAQFISKCRRIEPPFGESMDDIALMTEQWKALDAHVPLKQSRSLHVPKDVWNRIYGGRRNESREKDAQAKRAGAQEGRE